MWEGIFIRFFVLKKWTAGQYYGSGLVNMTKVLTALRKAFQQWPCLLVFVETREHDEPVDITVLGKRFYNCNNTYKDLIAEGNLSVGI